MYLELTKDQQEIRDRVVDFLLLFSSEKCRKALAMTMPAERVAYELARIWFEQIYTPSIRYLDSLKGDFSEQAVVEFEEAFDVEELITMERFHRFFELRFDMIASRVKASGEFPQTESWQNIIKDAGYLLEELIPRAADRKARLEKILKEKLQIYAKIDGGEMPGLESGVQP